MLMLTTFLISMPLVTLVVLLLVIRSRIRARIALQLLSLTAITNELPCPSASAYGAS